MRIGMLARSEDRGLGVLCWEWFRNMRPDKTLLVIPEAVAKAGLVSHIGRFPDSTHARFRQAQRGSQAVGELDENLCREWLHGLDVVFSAETFYDWRFCRWAEEAGVATVCLAMPEFVRPSWFGQPTQWWAPTRYRLNYLPGGTRIVPVPIPTDRWNGGRRTKTDAPVRWLHVAGAQTIDDRNGTRVLLEALRLVHREHGVTISMQTPIKDFDVHLPVSSSVELRFLDQSIPDYWRLYDVDDALVMPRRYAGLCLPVLEAIGAGLAVMMSDMEPQRSEWPVTFAKTNPGKPLRMLGGTVETGNVDPRALANQMDAWAAEPHLVDNARDRSRAYAETHSWEAMEPFVREELHRAVELMNSRTG